MTIGEIREKAKRLGIDLSTFDHSSTYKKDLIQAIQQKEGYTPCFGSKNCDYPHTRCCWRVDCFSSRLMVFSPWKI